MKISRNIVSGPKSNNSFLVGIWVIVCVQKPSHRLLQTFPPLRRFKIVLLDNSLYPKQLSLFCLLRLASARAYPIGYITNFCSMIELLQKLKNSSFQHRSIQAFYNVTATRKENKKFGGLLCITQNRKVSCVLDAPSQFMCTLARFDLANRGGR